MTTGLNDSEGSKFEAMTVVLTNLSTMEVPGDDARVVDGVLTIFLRSSISAVFAAGEWVRAEKEPAAVKKPAAPRYGSL